MDIAIAIFAKNPDLSPVKTRLARDIGEANAIAFYRLCLQAVQQLVQELVAASSHSITPYWALAEQQSCGLPAWQCFDTLWTGEGDLGERLHQVYSTLLKKHDAVMVIGSDCPGLVSGILLQAVDFLEQYPRRVVIGPACDGGFYLFAAQVPVAEKVWRATPYSCSNTRHELHMQLRAQFLRTVYTESCADVDNRDNLLQLRQELQARPVLGPLLQDVLEFIDGLRLLQH